MSSGRPPAANNLLTNKVWDCTALAPICSPCHATDAPSHKHVSWQTARVAETRPGETSDTLFMVQLALNGRRSPISHTCDPNVHSELHSTMTGAENVGKRLPDPQRHMYCPRVIRQGWHEGGQRISEHKLGPESARRRDDLPITQPQLANATRVQTLYGIDVTQRQSNYLYPKHEHQQRSAGAQATRPIINESDDGTMGKKAYTKA